MNGQDATETTASTARRACLVEGCTCKDARIVSTRRATYFASVAKARGETADRIVAADAGSGGLPVSPAARRRAGPRGRARDVERAQPARGGLTPRDSARPAAPQAPSDAHPHPGLAQHRKERSR